MVHQDPIEVISGTTRYKTTISVEEMPAVGKTIEFMDQGENLVGIVVRVDFVASFTCREKLDKKPHRLNYSIVAKLI